MVAYPIPHRLKLSLAPTFAIAAGACVALACMVAPAAVLETLVLDSGIPALFPAAAPPLGWTARTALAMIAGGGVAAVVWIATMLLLGGEREMTFAPRRLALPNMPNFSKLAHGARRDKITPEAAPVLRRADAHPDAPARAPLLALRDLGTPFLDVRASDPEPVERELPRNLDAPLAAFDPHAIPDVAAEPVRPVAPLHAVRNPAVIEAGERFEAFELRPPVAVPLDQPPIAAPRTDATIHALLDRLERGVSNRAGPPPRPGVVDDALTELRWLATR